MSRLSPYIIVFLFGFSQIFAIARDFNVPYLVDIYFIKYTCYLLVIPAIIFLCKDYLGRQLSIHEHMVVFVVPLFLIVYMLIAILFFGDISDHHGMNNYKFNLPMIANTFMVYILSFYIGYVSLENTNKILIYTGWFLLVSSVLFIVDFSMLSIDFSKSINPYDRSFTLGLSDYFSLYTLIVLSTLNETKKQILLIISSLLVLFFISSRTALVFFLLSSLLHFIMVSRNKYTSVFSVIFMVFLLSIIFSYLNDNTMGYSSRIFSLGGSDVSVEGRFSLFQALNDQLTEPSKIFFGGFGDQIYFSYGNESPRWGAYIHSMLSYLRQFGVVFFILVCYMVSSTFKVLFSKVDNRLIPLIMYIIFVMLTSRSYIFPWVFIFPGLFYFYVKDKSRYGNY